MSKKSAGPTSGYVKGGGGGAYQDAATATAQGNRPDQSTPFGNTSWGFDPTTGAWSQSTGASGELSKGLFNLMGQSGTAGGTQVSNGEDARKKAYDSIYGRATARLDPQFAQADNAVQTQLLNQGFVPGTTAYDTAYKNFSNQKNDAYATARQDAETQSGNAAQQQQQMDVTAQQAPFSTMNMIRSLLQMPGFSAGPDYLSAAMGTGQYNLQNQQMENQGWGDLMGGLFNLGGSLGSAGILGQYLKKPT